MIHFPEIELLRLINKGLPTHWEAGEVNEHPFLSGKAFAFGDMVDV